MSTKSWSTLRCLIIVLALARVCGVDSATGQDRIGLFFACSANNDLYVATQHDGRVFPRFDSTKEAIAAAADGDAVLVLADDYPGKTTTIAPDLFREAAKKRLRLYVEYPSTLPEMKLGTPRRTGVERAVVSSDFFGPELTQLRILAINGLHFVPVSAEKSHIVAARVAGFDTAVYGLPEASYPILFEHPDGGMLVATTKLSHFVTGRYAPADAWRTLWQGVLGWLCRGQDVPELRWTPVVRASYGVDEPLPADAEEQALRRGVEWFVKSKLLLHPSRLEKIEGAATAPTPPPDAPVGDGSLGILEAPLSIIQHDGSQLQSVARRGDCTGESAMAIAFGGTSLDDAQKSKIAENLLDFWYFTSDACKKERTDPQHGAYGLIAWGVTSPSWYKANYGDDNARLLMGTMAVAALADEDRWDELMMRCLLANLRTTGPLGFRGGRIDVGPLGQHGWQSYFRRRTINPHPHYESYLWACFLWAYQQTGYELFYQRAESALRITMGQYTDGWRWTNGVAQEKARIVLPLAWLVRVKDTPEHRAWLRQAVDGLLALQEPCGAIREELGLAGRGQYPPPSSNEAYGTTEASLIQQNGDPVSDLLYTTNFAFIGLHEAAAATGDKDILKAQDKLAEFLCRIQVQSTAQPSLDGGWFRAFDFQRWEHWGSNADAGWGAWAIESGWTQGWIASVLAMRRMETSLWDLTQDSKIEKHFDQLRHEMLPDDVLAAAKPERVAHEAVGKTVKLATPLDLRYPGSGPAGLVDGFVGIADHTAPEWLGLEGADLMATVDLGKPMNISSLGAAFLQSTAVGIFLPPCVEFSVSADGNTFTTVATVKPKTSEREPGPLREMLITDKLDTQGRYVRVRAESVGKIPDWHRAAGREGWLFVDEVLVNP
ncbi:MAG: discoidin domain-containing protein [Planctomycetes bacterium]|nr:discoidin domain-containing protein [Planctomycetota bacterium]